MGYHRAGFEVVGVDIKPQPHYPFEFHRADAMTYPLEGFDAIHASPPCQAWSEITPISYRGNHPQLIAPIRERLRASRVPYAIENVEAARGEMIGPVRLCGSMFGLEVERHRYFEVCPAILMSPASCNHSRPPVLVGLGTPNAGKRGPVSPTGTTRRRSGRFEWTADEARIAMDVPWMTRVELDEAIPPAYTEWVGTQLLQAIEKVA
jgi:DNA (cytosine-5)-methyltransferase 1